MTRNALRTATLAIALGLLTAACGSGDGGNGSGTIDLAQGLPSAAVCNGEPSDSNPPATDPISGYVYLNGGDGWTTGWFDTFGEQHAIAGDFATSILCVTVVESSEGERCPFEDDGDEFELIMMNATYEFSFRNADSANEIARGTATATAEECPLIGSWSEGETERRSWPQPTDGEIQDMIDVFFS